jgi:hypothetical protein
MFGVAGRCELPEFAFSATSTSATLCKPKRESKESFRLSFALLLPSKNSQSEPTFHITGAL